VVQVRDAKIEEPGEEADPLTVGREGVRQVDAQGEQRFARGGDGPSVTSAVPKNPISRLREGKR
jgi:hypothetical protein